MYTVGLGGRGWGIRAFFNLRKPQKLQAKIVTNHYQLLNMNELKVFTEYPDRAIAILQRTIRTEILRMEQGKKQIEQKLQTFEQKYQISSREFVTSWTAENLEGKDLEYVEWFGEYRCLENITQDLQILLSLQNISQNVSI